MIYLTLSDDADLIICGWVIAYGDDKQKAAENDKGSQKMDANCSFSYLFSKTNEEIEESRGYLIGSEERIEDTNFINSLF